MLKSEVKLVAPVSWILAVTCTCVLGGVGLTPSSVHAAACCAGSGAAPSVISGDDVAQVSVSAARGTVIGDAPAEGLPVFRNGATSEVTEIYLLSGAILVADRWQVGAGVPILRHEAAAKSTGSSSGLGDIRLNGAYEFLPEWTYSAWKPRGFGFLQFTLPTGTSVYDTQSAGAVDALGKGFYSLGAGSLLVKRWSAWDTYAIPEVHFSFRRTFRNENAEQLQIGSGSGASVSWGVGMSPGEGNFRIGLRLQPLYESPKGVVSDGATSRSGHQLSWNTALEATYLVSTAWAINGMYVDQTLLGPAVNTTLSRTLALGLQRRWER
ncbi:MAG: hypothetical protein H7222_02560 [Methylotenera sp.]|nr:hypothetical protein [Oligoflexia bacterium]